MTTQLSVPQLLLNDDEQVLDPSVFEQQWAATSISRSVSPIACCEPEPGDIEPFPDYVEPESHLLDGSDEGPAYRARWPRLSHQLPSSGARHSWTCEGMPSTDTYAHRMQPSTTSVAAPHHHPDSPADAARSGESSEQSKSVSRSSNSPSSAEGEQSDPKGGHSSRDDVDASDTSDVNEDDGGPSLEVFPGAE